MIDLPFLSLLTALSVCLGAGGCALVVRRRRYGRHLKYDPAQDCCSGIGGPRVEILPLDCGEYGFVLPRHKSRVVSALLELDIQTTIWGAYFDPILEVEADDWRDIFTTERGARGKRLFNVTRLMTRAEKGEVKVRLRGRRLNWNRDGARLHLCGDDVAPNERVLIVAPHPDDAEIAAFGLYADCNATIVTLTAGDNSDRYGSLTPRLQGLSRAQVAKMRVWESICIPRLGEVSLENALNLCFPDGRLSEMRARPSVDFANDGKGALDFDGLRRLNCSALVRETSNSERPACSWNALIGDLKHILESLQPTVIVTPHPVLDLHEDHVAATAAVIEASRAAGLSEGRFFFYCVHNHRSELWPFGPAGTGMVHLPILKDNGVEASGLYSHQLSPERQTDKLIALEAMHDVREMEWPTRVSFRAVAATLRGVLRCLVDGLDRTPTSYLRRAVRPDEPFFIVEFNEARKLVEVSPYAEVKS